MKPRPAVVAIAFGGLLVLVLSCAACQTTGSLSAADAEKAVRDNFQAWHTGLGFSGETPLRAADYVSLDKVQYMDKSVKADGSADVIVHCEFSVKKAYPSGPARVEYYVAGGDSLLINGGVLCNGMKLENMGSTGSCNIRFAMRRFDSGWRVQ